MHEIIIRWVAIIAIKLEMLKTLQDMDKVVIRYENNSSVRYDGKEYRVLTVFSFLCFESGSSGSICSREKSSRESSAFE